MYVRGPLSVSTQTFDGFPHLSTLFHGNLWSCLGVIDKNVLKALNLSLNPGPPSKQNQFFHAAPGNSCVQTEMLNSPISQNERKQKNIPGSSTASRAISFTVFFPSRMTNPPIRFEHLSGGFVMRQTLKQLPENK